MQVDKIRGHQTDQLIKAVLALKDKEEAYRFFDDLCTISEIQSMSQRLEVAHMLRMKKTYEKIKNESHHRLIRTRYQDPVKSTNPH